MVWRLAVWFEGADGGGACLMSDRGWLREQPSPAGYGVDHVGDFGCGFGACAAKGAAKGADGQAQTFFWWPKTWSTLAVMLSCGPWRGACAWACLGVFGHVWASGVRGAFVSGSGVGLCWVWGGSGAS